MFSGLQWHDTHQIFVRRHSGEIGSQVVRCNSRIDITIFKLDCDFVFVVNEYGAKQPTVDRDSELCCQLLVRGRLGQLCNVGMVASAARPNVFCDVSYLERVCPSAPVSNESADTRYTKKKAPVGQLAYCAVDGHP